MQEGIRFELGIGCVVHRLDNVRDRWSVRDREHHLLVHALAQLIVEVLVPEAIRVPLHWIERLLHLPRHHSHRWLRSLQRLPPQPLMNSLMIVQLLLTFETSALLKTVCTERLTSLAFFLSLLSISSRLTPSDSLFLSLSLPPAAWKFSSTFTWLLKHSTTFSQLLSGPVLALFPNQYGHENTSTNFHRNLNSDSQPSYCSNVPCNRSLALRRARDRSRIDQRRSNRWLAWD